MISIKFNYISRILLFFALMAMPLTGVWGQTIRIMPLGNSITAGSMCTNGDIHSCEPLGGNNAVGYRQSLYNLLSAAGYDFDFVGSETYGNSLMSDSDCAGFGGIRDSQLADIMETGTSSHTSGTVTGGPYMNYYPADIVLLHIGTNDILASDTATTDISRILNAIDAYESANSTTVTVFLARIISTRYASCGSSPWVTAYNRLIDQLAASRIAAGDNLILVDMECGAGIDYDNDLADQVHPNQDGYDKMGAAWFAAIEAWSGSSEPSYSLTMETPVGSGTTSPAEGLHNYPQGSTVSVSATAGAGYDFAGWSGSITGSDNPAEVLMDGDKEITATFEQRSYDLSVTTDGTSGAVVDPEGTISVVHGTETPISVSTVPEGSSFAGWEIVSGSSVSIADPFALNTTVTLNSGAATIQATFGPPSHSISITVSGEGSVDKDPDQAGYEDNTVLTLTATPDNGSYFDAWSGDLSGSENPAEVLMDGDKEITATFLKHSYELTLTTDGTSGAVVNPAGTVSVEHGVETSISVSSVPEGSSFTGWEIISGSSVSIANPSALNTTVTLNSGPATIRANFSTVTHSVRIDITGEGSVDKDPDLEDYPLNSTVSLTAIPAEGYYFYAWTGNVTGTANPADLVMDGEKGLRATFLKSHYNLTVNTDGTEGTAVSPAGTVSVEHGVETSISVSSIPDGSTFYGWEVVSGSSVTLADPSSLSTTIKLESGDASIRANFAPFSHQCTLSVNGQGSVNRNPDLDEYPNNSELVLTAIPDDGYYFSGWTGDLSGSENPATVLMTGDKDITAGFEKLSYELTVGTDGTLGAVVDPEGKVSVEHGMETSISVSQVPEGFSFDGWELSSGSSATITNPSSLSTTIILESGNATVQANFAVITHTLTLQVSGGGSVDKAPDQAEYAHNSVSVLTALPEYGYYFDGWTGNLEGSDNPADVLMDGDKVITASFEKLSYELTISTDGTDGAMLDPEGTVRVDHGVETSISVSQVPEGFHFTGWEISSGSSITIAEPASLSTTIILESGNAAIQASFTDSSATDLPRISGEGGSMHLYPNPAEDHFYVTATGNTKGRILVSDANGRLIISRSSVDISHGIRINISGLSPGIYMIQWIPESGVNLKGKFMKID